MCNTVHSEMLANGDSVNQTRELNCKDTFEVIWPF